MKVEIDHIGIAVDDLETALGFYRDLLGLEVEASEDVVTQGVRAHRLPAGGASLELLEATRPDSPVGRFLGRRGPGIHHVTLRVDDLEAALARLRAGGATLIDETPRIGAGGARIAFVHPSAAHGVLIELKETGR
jgi:methylmalonyl-CoA/ethylmalonyl-CoA epimerase